MQKFQFIYLPGGYIEVHWRDIKVSIGRPWIRDKAHPDYSELLNYLWDLGTEEEVNKDPPQ